MDEAFAELLTPPKKNRLGDRIAADIKQLIFSHKIESGQKLPAERELASMLQVSRVVVREALRVLEHSGLIEITGSPKGGAVVVANLYKPMARSMTDLYHQGQLTLEHFVEMRKATECSLIRQAAVSADPPDLEAIAALNRKLMDDSEEVADFPRNHRDFHLAVAKLAGNPLGVLIVRSLFEILNVVRPYVGLSREFIEHTYHRHEIILSAIESRDPERCVQAMAVDVEQTKQLPAARRVR